MDGYEQDFDELEDHEPVDEAEPSDDSEPVDDEAEDEDVEGFLPVEIAYIEIDG